MQFLSDLFLAAAAAGAAVYCFVLSRRLSALGSLEGGMGQAIAVLSSQVDELQRALASAQDSAAKARAGLDEQTRRAEAVSRKLELMVASMHDLPDAQTDDRSPSRWPVEAGMRAAPTSERSDTTPRTRILRRRPTQEGA